MTEDDETDYMAGSEIAEEYRRLRDAARDLVEREVARVEGTLFELAPGGQHPHVVEADGPRTTVHLDVSAEDARRISVVLYKPCTFVVLELPEPQDSPGPDREHVAAPPPNTRKQLKPTPCIHCGKRVYVGKREATGWRHFNCAHADDVRDVGLAVRDRGLRARVEAVRESWSHSNFVGDDKAALAAIAGSFVSDLEDALDPEPDDRSPPTNPEAEVAEASTQKRVPCDARLHDRRQCGDRAVGMVILRDDPTRHEYPRCRTHLPSTAAYDILPFADDSPAASEKDGADDVDHEGHDDVVRLEGREGEPMHGVPGAGAVDGERPTSGESSSRVDAQEREGLLPEARAEVVRHPDGSVCLEGTQRVPTNFRPCCTTFEDHTKACVYDVRYEWSSQHGWMTAISESAGGGGIAMTYCPHCGMRLAGGPVGET